MQVIDTSNIILVNKKVGGYQLEYLRARIFSDGVIEFFQQVLNPKDYSPLDKGSSFVCHLNTKEDSQEGVTLYG